MRLENKVIHRHPKTRLKRLQMALFGFIRISLPTYARICVLFLFCFIVGKNMMRKNGKMRRKRDFFVNKC